MQRDSKNELGKPQKFFEVPALSPSICVALDSLFTLAEPQFPHSPNDGNNPCLTSLTGSAWGSNKVL